MPDVEGTDLKGLESISFQIRPDLRKESGSLIASNFGIEAARQHLGHREIRTTSSHYVGKKTRIEINLPLSSKTDPKERSALLD